MTGLNRRRLLLGSAALIPAVLARPAVAGSDPEQDQGPEEVPRFGRTPRTRFAVNIEMWWNGMPYAARLRRAAAFGFPAVEFWGLGNKDVPAIASLARELGLEIAQFTGWGFSPGLNDPANHDHFERTIRENCEHAHTFGAKCMTVVAGNNRKGVSQEDMLAAVTRGLERVVPIVEEAGVTLILEPMNGRVDHPGHCLYGSADAIDICKRVGSPRVKINWDLYHMQISEGDLCGHLRDGFEHVGYLQLADHPGRHEPGTGEINYNRVLREAWDLGYRGFVGLECSPRDDALSAARRVFQADVW